MFVNIYKCFSAIIMILPLIETTTIRNLKGTHLIKLSLSIPYAFYVHLDLALKNLEEDPKYSLQTVKRACKILYTEDPAQGMGSGSRYTT